VRLPAESQPARPVVAFGVTPQNAVAEGEAPPNGGPREACLSASGGTSLWLAQQFLPQR